MARPRFTSPDAVGSVPGLSQHRARRGVTLEQIAQSTKISLRFLRAIEAEQFEQLPGGIFNTSYIRQYAAAVGLDEDTLLASYHRQAGGETNGNGNGSRRSALDWIRTISSLKL
ncbi:MAG: helix-turn-helix domain-containing protein [bacterium]|nr:helix-turn-helix domain-containing protein [bacterium]